MDPEPHATDCSEASSGDARPVPRIAEWIWRPWYAKFWWAFIPIYWIGAAISSRVPLLRDFYSSALGGFINVFAFPPTALMVLSVGFLRQHIGPSEQPGSGDFQPLSTHHEIGRPPPELDPLNPNAGAYWIGSPATSISEHRHI